MPEILPTPGQVLTNILEGAEKEGVGRIPSDWEVRVWLQERRARKPAHPAFAVDLTKSGVDDLQNKYLALASDVQALAVTVQFWQEKYVGLLNWELDRRAVLKRSWWKRFRYRLGRAIAGDVFE